MDEKNFITLVNTLCEKVRELEMELGLAKYERDELRREKEGKKND